MMESLGNVLVYIVDSGEGFIVLKLHFFFILQFKLSTFSFPGMEIAMRNDKM